MGLVIVGMIVVSIAIIGWKMHLRGRAKQAWRSMAASHGMSFTDGGFFGQFHLDGTYRGVEVDVSTETRGSGKHSKTYTIYQASVPEAVPFGLIVYDEGFFSKVGKFFGGQDIEIGDRVVDEAYIIKSDVPSEIHRFFDRPGVTDAFRQLAHRGHDIHLDHGRIEIDKLGRARSQGELEQKLGVLADFSLKLAESLQENTAKTGETRDTDEQEAATRDAEDQEFIAEW